MACRRPLYFATLVLGVQALAAWPTLAQPVVDAIPARTPTARPPVNLEPTTAWVADFAEESCALRRGFGDGEHTASLELRQFSTGNWMQAAVASPTLDARVRSPQGYFLPDRPDEDPVEIPFYQSVATSDGGKGVIVPTSLMSQADRALDRGSEEFFVWADTDRDRREREVTGYYLSDAFRNDVILHTGPMHQPMDVMRTCLDDLLTRWGLDPKADRLKTREVELNAGDSLWGKLGNIIGVRRDSGMARARLLIDEAGQLTDCHVLEGLPAGERADAFCEAVRKEAEFEPALDRSAQPMRSYYILDFAAIRRRSF